MSNSTLQRARVRDVDGLPAMALPLAPPASIPVPGGAAAAHAMLYCAYAHACDATRPTSPAVWGERGEWGEPPPGEDLLPDAEWAEPPAELMRPGGRRLPWRRTSLCLPCPPL